jgi:hypothetical protein
VTTLRAETPEGFLRRLRNGILALSAAMSGGGDERRHGEDEAAGQRDSSGDGAAVGEELDGGNTDPSNYVDWPDDVARPRLNSNDADDLSFRPLYDRGGGVSVYRGPVGPLGELAKLELERREAAAAATTAADAEAPPDGDTPSSAEDAQE